MDQEILNKLKLSLEEKRPSLLLGAGFSCDSINQDGESLPIGVDLVNSLYEELFVNNPPDKDVYDDDNDAACAYREDGKLRELCSLLAQEGRREERNLIITKKFKGAHVKNDSYHNYLVDYKWDRIFTLNVDDLVENIYEEVSIPLLTWKGEKADRRNNNNNTILIKLHGCVRSLKYRYVFDDDEYADFYNQTSFLLRDFADAYVKGDMIFLGTEFQESDLRQIINRYKNSGYNTSANNYFFVCPQINDPILRRKIKETPNYHFINWTTEKFLNFLHNEINKKEEIKDELIEKGMIVIDDYQKSVNRSYESKIYTGREPRIDDFILEWDIRHPGLENFLKKIEKEKKPIVAAVVGQNYVGKTSFAIRVLIELWKKGYYSIKFDLKSSQYMHLFSEYLETLPDGTRVAVLFEDAAFYYNILYPILLDKCPPNIKKLIVITTETLRNYFVRKDILESNNAVIRFNLNINISWSYANNIYMKLKEKNWLNRPEVHGSTPNEIKQYAVEVNDIIEVLYNITNGRGFEQHYEDIINISNNKDQVKYLQMLSLLSMLGVTSVPSRIFPSLLVEEKKKFDISEFAFNYEEIVIADKDYIKLRCQRLIQNVLMKALSDSERKQIIIELVKEITGQFNEGDINEWSELFQKVLSVKALLAERIMDVSTIREMLNELENSARQYSFYWIQRGLAAQKDKDYDLADNYFRAAINVRKQSYQAHHALAKNLMERAISLLDENEGYAPYYMAEGEKEIKEIIDNPAFSRGLIYSVHTYIDMKLKYCKKTMQQMSVVEVDYIVQKILLLPVENIDRYMLVVINEFMDYAKSSKFEKEIFELERRRFDAVKERCEEEYLIENQDF